MARQKKKPKKRAASPETPPEAPGVEPGDVLFQVLAAWLVPGLGHLMAGHKRVGIALLCLISGAFFVGLVLSDYTAVSRVLNPWSFFAQLGIGGGTLPLLLIDPAQAQDLVLDARSAIETFKPVPRFTDTGVLFCNIAGLLNMLAIIDVVDRAVGRSGKAAA